MSSVSKGTLHNSGGCWLVRAIGIADITVCLISTPLHYVFNMLDCRLVRFTSMHWFKVLLKLVDYILMASTVCEGLTRRENFPWTFTFRSTVEFHSTTPNKINYIDFLDLVVCFLIFKQEVFWNPSHTVGYK